MVIWLIGLYSSLISYINPELAPIVHTEYRTEIAGFPEKSLANTISTIYYNVGGMDMVTTMIGENGGFNPDIVSSTNDHGLCQLNYRWHQAFIDSEAFKDPLKQAYYCVGVWQDAVRKGRLSTTFYAYNHRSLYKKRVTVITEKYYKLFGSKIYLK